MEIALVAPSRTFFEQWRGFVHPAALSQELRERQGRAGLVPVVLGAGKHFQTSDERRFRLSESPLSGANHALPLVRFGNGRDVFVAKQLYSAGDQPVGQLQIANSESCSSPQPEKLTAVPAFAARLTQLQPLVEHLGRIFPAVLMHQR